MKTTKTSLPYLAITLFALFGGMGSMCAQNAPVSVSPTQLTFNAQSGTGGPGAQNLVIVSNSASVVSFTATAFSGGNWLSVSPQSGTTPQVLAVSVNPGSLAAGTYGGFITIAAGSSTIPVQVILNVNAAGTSTFTAAPASLPFTFQAGSTVPQSQQVNITNSATSAVTFTATASTSNNGNWLSVNPNSGTTPGMLTVTVNPSSLTAGNYSGAIAINSPGTTGLVVPVAVTVAAPSTLTVTPQQLSFAFQVGTAAPAAQTLTLSTMGGNTISFTATPATTSCGSNWLIVSPQSSATPSTLTVQINTTGLQPGNCMGSINISAPGASNPTQSIPVTLLVSTNPLLQLPSIGPTFNYQLGTATPASQTVQVTSSSTPLNFTVAATPVSGGPNFLTVSPAAGVTGTTPQAITLSVNPTVLAGLAPNTYAENVTVSSPGAGNPAQSFIVTLVVSNNPMLVSTQSAVTFNYQIGQSSPPSQLVSLSSTGAPLPYTVSTSTTTCSGFLTATSAGGTTSVQGQPAQVVIGVNTTGLTTPQTCNGTVTLTVPGSTGSPLAIPVTLNVSSTPLINLSPASINMVSVLGSTTPATQAISLTSTDGATPLNFTATAATVPAGLTWLSVAPNTGSSPATLVVTLNPSNLPAGIYMGSINVSSTSTNVPAQTVPVMLTVGSGTIAASSSSLTFNQPLGGPAPQSQTFQVTGVPQGATVGATASVFSGTNFLTATTSGTTVTVSANGSQLSQGNYTGVVTVFVPGASNSPFYVPVTLRVGGAATFTTTPSSINFTFQAGSVPQPAQTVQLSSTSGSIPFSAVAIAPPGSAGGIVFITLSPTTGTTPGSLSVALNPTVVSTLSPGTYTNLVNLTSSSVPGATQSLIVMLTVTSAGPPTITAVVNGGSFQQGAVSPGEVVTIFGSNIGPATAAGLQLLPNGMVATTLGNTSVTFNGFPAPLIYVSANQINAIVPYEVATVSTATVAITNNTTGSNALQVNVVPTAPAIFALGQNGSGQGAILNQNNSVNGASNPAARGSVIIIYATGEGAITPAGITGSVTSSTGPNFPKPNGPVTVTIGGQPATVLYAGEAPGLVSGVLQVNAMVPSSIATGPQSVVITVGGASSPNVVTAAIQ